MCLLRFRNVFPCIQRLLLGFFLFLLFLLSACTDSVLESENERLEKENLVLHRDIALLRFEVERLQKIEEARSKHKNIPVRSLDLSQHPSLGYKSAKYAIIEFSDYQCPFCKRHLNEVFPRLKENFIDTGKLRYQVWNFPLDNHADAYGAGIAAVCAGKQNVFWQMHPLLFANSNGLGNGLYSQLADDLKLDTAAYQRCLKSKDASNKIMFDISYGKQYGVQGTPAFLIGEVANGRLVNFTLLRGAKSYHDFSALINRVTGADALK